MTYIYDHSKGTLIDDEKPFEKVLVNTSELEESLLTGIKKVNFGYTYENNSRNYTRKKR